MNDPLAYFITFSCYGHHLPGDGPYTIDRQHNIPGLPPAPPSSPRREYHVARLLQEPFEMDSARRAIVLESILEVCVHKDWYLAAAHVRSTHVHIVLQAPETRPELAMGVLKARASRKLSDS